MSQVDKARDVYFALRRYAQAQKISLQTAIELYVSERVLYRLSQTPHADDFVLKGAMMLVVWIGNRLRSTRDIDFRGFGSPAPERVKEVFAEAASLITDDGLTFDVQQIRIETIRAEDKYPGLRLVLPGILHKAQVQAVVEIGFSDAISPLPEKVIYPALLPDLPSIVLRGYAKETAVAEKFSIMLEWGELNTRLKDFYDILSLSDMCVFDGMVLAEALQKTLQHRNLKIPDESVWVFSKDARQSPIRQRQWKRYLLDTLAVTEPVEWSNALEKIEAFLLPLCLASQNKDEFRYTWFPRTGWIAKNLSGETSS